MGCSSAGNAPENVLSTVFQEQTAPLWVPHGPRFLPEDLFLHRLFMGYSLGVPSDMVLHGLQADNLLHHGLLPGLQEYLCSSTCSISSPSSSMTWVSAGLFFSHFLTLLSHSCCAMFLTLS